jgi:hypothetical protein
VLVLLVTVAVNCSVAAVLTDAEAGETVTLTAVVVDEEELPPPQAVKSAIKEHTTTDEMTRLIYHSWARLPGQD